MLAMAGRRVDSTAEVTADGDRLEKAESHWRVPLLLLLAASILLLSPPYITAFLAPAVGLFHDDGIYTITAKSLAEGRGYRLIDLPGEPAQTKYPPLLPLAIAAVWKLAPDFPQNVPYLKLIPLLCSVIWLVLSFFLLRALGLHQAVAFGIVFATAAGAFVMYLSTTLLSETMFAALATGSLLALETREGTMPVSTRRIVIAALLAALATLARIAGVALVGAIFGWMLSRRRWRSALLFGLIAGLILAPWALWVLSNPSSGYYTSDNYASWNVLSLSSPAPLGQRAIVVVRNLLAIFATPGFHYSLGEIAGPPVFLLTAVLAVAGAIRGVRQSRVTLWFLAAYLGIIVCWLWPPPRFVVVVFPLFMWLLLQAFPLSVVNARPIALLLVILAASVPSVILLYSNAATARQTGTLPINLPEIENWTEVREVASWIRDNTAPDTLVVGNLDPIYFLFSGRKAIRGFDADPFLLFYANDPEANALHLSWPKPGSEAREGGVIVVESPDYSFAEAPHLRKRIQEREKQGELITLKSFEHFRILRLKSSDSEKATD